MMPPMNVLGLPILAPLYTFSLLLALGTKDVLGNDMLCFKCSSEPGKENAQCNNSPPKNYLTTSASTRQSENKEEDAMYKSAETMLDSQVGLRFSARAKNFTTYFCATAISRSTSGEWGEFRRWKTYSNNHLPRDGNRRCTRQKDDYNQGWTITTCSCNVDECNDWPLDELREIAGLGTRSCYFCASLSGDSNADCLNSPPEKYLTEMVVTPLKDPEDERSSRKEIKSMKLAMSKLFASDGSSLERKGSGKNPNHYCMAAVLKVEDETLEGDPEGTWRVMRMNAYNPDEPITPKGKKHVCQKKKILEDEASVLMAGCACFKDDCNDTPYADLKAHALTLLSSGFMYQAAEARLMLLTGFLTFI